MILKYLKYFIDIKIFIKGNCVLFIFESNSTEQISKESLLCFYSSIKSMQLLLTQSWCQRLLLGVLICAWTDITFSLCACIEEVMFLVLSLYWGMRETS